MDSEQKIHEIVNNAFEKIEEKFDSITIQLEKIIKRGPTDGEIANQDGFSWLLVWVLLLSF